jgi:hypothetical protein
MEVNQENTLLDLVNLSGYPLQIGIENMISQSSQSHPWKVTAREHYWRNDELKKEGFIDLLLSWGSARMVIECKRMLDRDWIFLITDIKKYNRNDVRLLETFITQSSSSYEWKDVEYGPSSFESQFCIMGRERDRPSLESLSSELLMSIDSLANEEKSITLSYPNPSPARRAYIPVIITTANLHVCTFHPNDINLDEGRVTTSSFENVEYIRFRKGLSTADINNIQSANDIRELNKLNERTVFVIQANKFVTFLSKYVH